MNAEFTDAKVYLRRSGSTVQIMVDIPAQALTTQATKIGANQPTPSVATQLAALTAQVEALEGVEAL